MGEVKLRTAHGLLLEFQQDDQVIRPFVENTGQWEPEEEERISYLLDLREGWFVDLGAHVGYHSAVQLARNEHLKVLAVEANQAAGDLLAKNLSRWRNRCWIVHGPVWHESGAEVCLFQHEGGNGGDYRVCRPEDMIDGWLTMRTFTLDEIVRNQPEQFTRITAVKSDLQGRDHLALRGAWGVLLLHRPDVVVEFCPEMIREAPPAGSWDPSPEDVIRWYQECHYGVRLLDGTVLGNPADIVRMAEFLPGGAVTLWLQPIERLRSTC